MEKKCTKCGEVKSLDEFNRAKKGKHGRSARCRDCNKLYYENNKKEILKKNKDYREDNKEDLKKYFKDFYLKNRLKKIKEAKKYQINNSDKIKKARQKYYNKNRELHLEKGKIYRNKKEAKIIKKIYLETYNEENKDHLKEKNKVWREKNKERIKEYREKNRERLREYSNNWSREKLKTDPLFKLRSSIRTNIGTSLRKNGYTKENKTYNILKCDYDFFMQWLNNVASNGHTYGIGELHLDHVIPISLAETEDEAILLSHYSNYQLLSADENLAKSNRYVNPTNLKRVLEHHPNPDKIREIYSRL